MVWFGVFGKSYGHSKKAKFVEDIWLEPFLKKFSVTSDKIVRFIISSTMSSLSRIQPLRDFLRITQAWCPSKNFADSFNLSSTKVLRQIDTDNRILSYCEEKQLLTLQYRIPPFSFQPTKTHRQLPLSGFLGIIDIVTTWALVQHPQQNSQGRRPGVSIELYTELGPDGLDKIKSGDCVNVEVGVIKMGRNLGFTTAEIKDAATGQIICFGRHTKYLPMDFFRELALGHFFSWTKRFASIFPPKHSLLLSSSSGEGKPAENMKKDSEEYIESFDMETVLSWQSISSDAKKATFLVESHHLNENGTIHGGLLAMAMEKLGEESLQQNHPVEPNENRSWILKSIKASYLSAARKSTCIFVEVSDLKMKDSSLECTMAVQIKKMRNSQNGDKSIILTEGILRWTYEKQTDMVVSKL